MNVTRIVGILLIVAGVLGLVYRSFSYAKESHTATIGPIQFSMSDKERIEVPVWASVAVIVVGAGLLLAGGKK